MKLIKLITTASLFAVILFSGACADEPEISAHSAMLFCADTGDVLFERNADERMLIASTTKIMTAIVVLESCDIDEEVGIIPEHCAVEGSLMYIKPGETYTVRELLMGLMLVSGNDAATALAYHTAGGIEEFATLMNDKARELGMKNTAYKNPHGLDELGHYSTAHDLAILAAYCMENGDFAEIVGTKSCTVGELTYVNHNKLLWDCGGCLGIKTGYTKASGRSLVSCCEGDGMRLVCVTLGAPDDWNDHKKLYDWGYDSFSLTRFDRESFRKELDVISGTIGHTCAVPEKPVCVLTRPDDAVKTELYLPRLIFAGFLEGEKVGELRVFINGELAAQENMVYTESVKTDLNQRLTLRERISRLFDIGAKPYYISETHSERKTSENNLGLGHGIPQSRGGAY